MKFTIKFRTLGMSELERLCERSSGDINRVMSATGLGSSYNPSVSVPVGRALQVCCLTLAPRYGIEVTKLMPFVSQLSSEALLKLGEDIDNWILNDPDNNRRFWEIFYGDSARTRSFIAGPLGCQLESASRWLRFHDDTGINLSTTPRNDQERVTPRFVIDAHNLAERVTLVCGSPLFTARVASA